MIILLITIIILLVIIVYLDNILKEIKANNIENKKILIEILAELRKNK